MALKALRMAGLVTLLLAYLSTTRFARNIPFHLNPPVFPASLANFAWSASSPLGPSSSSYEQFTVRSSSSLSLADRLAFCEDAVPFSSEGDSLVLLSCDTNRRDWNTVMGPLADPFAGSGALWILEPVPGDGGEPQVQKVELEFPALAAGRAQFHPLGVELLETEGESTPSGLLVINHGADESTIEVFSFSRPSTFAHRYKAVHTHTLRHPTFSGAPNSLAILPGTSSFTLRFFLTHDHRFNRRTTSPFLNLANFVETVGAMALSRVDYVEVILQSQGGMEPKIQVETVLPGIAFANGLALSHDGNTLVVASTTRRELRFYAVQASTTDGAPSLSLIRVAHVPFLVDNHSLLPSTSSTDAGNSHSLTILAAGHPSYPAILSAAHKLRLSLHLPHFLSRFFAWPGLDFDWQVQSGMSWAAAVQHPRPASTKVDEPDWETVFASHGRRAEGGFGGSTTAVGGQAVGKSGERTTWLVVPGLYEEGVKVIRQAA
ncbi:hypothetical protein JCM11251_001873 [Rhodosporidiobolus azoricus]